MSFKRGSKSGWDVGVDAVKREGVEERTDSISSSPTRFGIAEIGKKAVFEVSPVVKPSQISYPKKPPYLK